jgi:hypothetical protein
MHQIGYKNAFFGVIEDPGKDDCKSQNNQKKNEEIHEVDIKAGAWSSSMIRRQEEQ